MSWEFSWEFLFLSPLRSPFSAVCEIFQDNLLLIFTVFPFVKCMTQAAKAAPSVPHPAAGLCDRIQGGQEIFLYFVVQFLSRV